MKSIKISAKERTDLGKKSTKKLRAQGMVPCVMYGGEKNIHFYTSENDLRHIIYTHEIFLIEIDIEGKSYKAILKDAQFHPVSDKVLHLDFVQVYEDKPTIVSLPIELVGNSVGIMAGGKLRQRRRYLKVKGLAKDLPETLKIDITKVDIGDVIKVSALEYENLELLDPKQAMIVGVASSRVVAKGMEAVVEEEAAEGEAPTEGEAPSAEGEASDESKEDASSES